MNRELKAAYNRVYYKNHKEFERAHKNHPSVIRAKARRRETMQRIYSENVEKYSSLQKAIKSARRNRGWSQSDLAKIMGVSFQLVSHWESGRAKAPWDKLCKVMPELKEVRG